MLTSELEILCPYCKEPNHVDISIYTEDQLRNLEDTCVICGNNFSYDVKVRYDVNIFANA